MPHTSSNPVPPGPRLQYFSLGLHLRVENSVPMHDSTRASSQGTRQKALDRASCLSESEAGECCLFGIDAYRRQRQRLQAHGDLRQLSPGHLNTANSGGTARPERQVPKSCRKSEESSVEPRLCRRSLDSLTAAFPLEAVRHQLVVVVFLLVAPP